MKKQQKWSGVKLSKKDLEESKAYARQEFTIDIISALAIVIFGIVIIAILMEMMS